MFTGIVETSVKIIEKNSSSITIERPEIFNSLRIGESIACNGCCLSVKSFADKQISFDVLSETFRRTNLSTSKKVNIERAMPSHGRFEGHVVLGHIDGTIEFLTKTKEESGWKFLFQIPEGYNPYLVEKGSICINGVSLTIGKVFESEKYFEVFLIPITYRDTNLGNIEPKEKVNFEIDYFAKLILKNQKINN